MHFSPICASTYLEMAPVGLQCLSVVVLFVCSAGTTVSSSTSADELPVVQVRLAPPAEPLPQISAELGELGHLREHLETELFRKLEMAYNATLDAAATSITKVVDSVVHRASSEGSAGGGATFLRETASKMHDAGGAFAVKVNVAPVSAPDSSVKGLIERVEDKRATDEVAMFNQACAEMQGLTDVVLNELGAEVHAQIAAVQQRRAKTTFLQMRTSSRGLPRMANVRVAASEEPFPTVSAMVEVMEAERDQTESLARRRILELETRLLEAEKQMIGKSLEIALGHVLA